MHARHALVAAAWRQSILSGSLGNAAVQSPMCVCVCVSFKQEQIK